VSKERRFTMRSERLHRYSYPRTASLALGPYVVLLNYLQLCKCHYNWINEEIHKHYRRSSLQTVQTTF